MRIMENNENNFSNISQCVSSPPQHEPNYFVAVFWKIVACLTDGIMRIYQYLIRIHFSVCLDLDFWLELNLKMNFTNEDMHLW